MLSLLIAGGKPDDIDILTALTRPYLPIPAHPRPSLPIPAHCRPSQEAKWSQSTRDLAIELKATTSAPKHVHLSPAPSLEPHMPCPGPECPVQVGSEYTMDDIRLIALQGPKLPRIEASILPPCSLPHAACPMQPGRGLAVLHVPPMHVALPSHAPHPDAEGCMEAQQCTAPRQSRGHRAE